jgi:hypothetical protein
LSGALLAGLFGRAFTFAEEFITNIDTDGEDFVVVGAGLFQHAVVRREAVLLLGELLEAALGVEPGAGLEDVS